MTKKDKCQKLSAFVIKLDAKVFVRGGRTNVLTNMYISSSLDHAMNRFVISIRQTRADLRSSLLSSGPAAGSSVLEPSESSRASKAILAPASRDSRRAYLLAVGRVVVNPRALKTLDTLCCTQPWKK